MNDIYSKALKCALIITLLIGLATCIQPSISPQMQAYKTAMQLNDYGMWKSSTMLPLIEKATADPNFLPAHLLKAKVWNQLGNSSNAIQAGQHVVARDPGNAEAWLEIGRAYEVKGRNLYYSPYTHAQAEPNFLAAESALLNATAADPNNEAAWVALGDLYRHRFDNVEMSHEAYAKALLINPYNPIANNGIRWRHP